MGIHIQRWVYRDGNHVIRVENGFSLSGWSQERLVVDGEEVQTAKGWWQHARNFDEPWLTRLGDTELKIEMRAGLMKIHVRVTIDGRDLERESFDKLLWNGARGTWPPWAPPIN